MQVVLDYIYGYGWRKPLAISWKLATEPQVKGVLLSENPMRGGTAQDPPTDRVQTKVCRSLHHGRFAPWHTGGEFNSHPLPVQTPHSKR